MSGCLDSTQLRYHNTLDLEANGDGGVCDQTERWNKRLSSKSVIFDSR